MPSVCLMGLYSVDLQVMLTIQQMHWICCCVSPRTCQLFLKLLVFGVWMAYSDRLFHVLRKSLYRHVFWLLACIPFLSGLWFGLRLFSWRAFWRADFLFWLWSWTCGWCLLAYVWTTDLAAREVLGGLCMASLLRLASFWFLYVEPFPWLCSP